MKICKILILYGENEFLVEMCKSQLITEILSFFYFNKNFITNFFSKLQKNISGYKIFEDICGFGLLHRF